MAVDISHGQVKGFAEAQAKAVGHPITLTETPKLTDTYRDTQVNGRLTGKAGRLF
jgi:hypothetical protein